MNLSNKVENKNNELSKRICYMEETIQEATSQLSIINKQIFSKADKKDLEHLVSGKIEPDYLFLKSELESKANAIDFLKVKDDLGRLVITNNEYFNRLFEENQAVKDEIHHSNKSISILESKINQQIDTICIDYSQCCGRIEDKQQSLKNEIQENIYQIRNEYEENTLKIRNDLNKIQIESKENHSNLVDEFLSKQELFSSNVNKNLSNFKNEQEELRDKDRENSDKIDYLEKRVENIFNDIEEKIRISGKLLETKLNEREDKVDLISRLQETQNLVQLQECEIQNLSKRLETNLNLSNSSKQFERLGEIERELVKKIELKADYESVTDMTDKLNMIYKNETKKIYNYLENSFKIFEEEIQKYVNKKVKEKDEILETELITQPIKLENQNHGINNSTLLNYTTSNTMLTNISQNGVNREIKQLGINLEKLRDYVIENYATKIDIQDIKNLIEKHKSQFDFSKKEDLIEKKDILYFEDEIKLIKTELEKKCNLESLDAMIDSQTQINDFLCSENCLGRWIWHSGVLVNKYFVPWEYQVINTVPENYFWEKNQHTLVILSKGLYDICLGVFTSSERAKITLNLNGEILLSNFKKNYSIDNDGKMSKNNSFNKKEESFNGLSIREVVSLPSRSRLTMSYYCEVAAEGFISIKKL